ncbi:Sensor histidine kinase TmoS [Nocardioides dokdonensis FR1436]|uniref:histidine kinase n=1 Tax=Nocardioides dokdonensis FR1436 TaxID=1300347 RepID=A0A1A9GRA1_9ACTN|nr:ATP-binding protein [Nocardioides dokdonensis]ANH40170.1 Sensor histidine kinase TmoS [Nocardioides dokdonensis FR1436]
MSSSGRAHLTAPATVALLVAVYAAGLASVVLRPADNPVAVWWPAAGLSVALVALTRPGRRELALVAVALVLATGLANLSGGRPLDLSLAFGVANTAEAVAAALVLRSGPLPGPPRLGELRDFVRLVVGALLGATIVAGLLGAAAAPFDLGPALDVARTVFTSHSAAVLVIVPVALVRRGRSGGLVPGAYVAPAELLAQLGVLGLATVAVFLPDHALSLTFVPLLVLVWAALRFGPFVTAIELVGFATAVTLLTQGGGGPFTNDGLGPILSASVAQGYLVCAVLLTLPLAVLLQERNRLFDTVGEERQLFRANFTDSLVGQLLLREGADGLRVDEVNRTISTLLGREPDDLTGREISEILDLGAQRRLADLLDGSAGWRGRGGVVGRPDLRLDIAASRISHGVDERVWSLQLLDVTAEHLAHQRLQEAERLTSATLDTTACLILVTDLDARVVRINAATTGMTGWSAADLVGRRLWETPLAPDSEQELGALLLWPNRSGAPVVGEHDALTRSGERRRVVWSNNLVRDHDGRPAYAVLTGVDVTTERASAGLVTHLMQASVATAIVGLDSAGLITVFSSGAEHLLRLPAHRVVGQPFTQLLDPDQVRERIGSTDHATVFAALTASIGQVEEASRDWWWIDADGGRRVVSMTLSATGTVVSTQVGFLCVGRDVTEQRRAQDVVVAALEQQRTAVERLRAIDEAKNEFVSTVSHELRTPVTSIVGYTEMLRDGTLVEPAPEQAPVLERIARNGERLIVLCNDLLMLSGLDSGAITWQAQDVDLAEVMRAVESTTPGLLRERDLTLVWEPPARPAVVVGDGEQLERVLLNLVSNAIKFTEDGGVVRVRLDIGPAEAVLVVTDTGIGIPDDEQDEVFDRFFRSSNAQRAAIQGTGLGLSIVASVAAAHGGTTQVRSAHLEGSTFTVRLPLKG